ncbi:hypothetical protein ACIBTV_27150 [Micromonospora sp. NPDC049366]|uniref:hypothetical protein n=1 Tax=Micromonospora sp. NPDC049366 TaxID=3364271 RepID=UPI0037A1F93C
MADWRYRPAVLHPTHRPEPDGERLVDDVRYCTVCSWAVETNLRGVTRTGRAGCEGPRDVGLRFRVQVVVGEIVDAR